MAQMLLAHESLALSKSIALREYYGLSVVALWLTSVATYLTQLPANCPPVPGHELKVETVRRRMSEYVVRVSCTLLSTHLCMKRNTQAIETVACGRDYDGHASVGLCNGIRTRCLEFSKHRTILHVLLRFLILSPGHSWPLLYWLRWHGLAGLRFEARWTLSREFSEKHRFWRVGLQEDQESTCNIFHSSISHDIGAL